MREAAGQTIGMRNPKIRGSPSLGVFRFDEVDPFRMGFRRIERGEEKAPGPKVQKGAFLI
jgi:hypothetical protein